MTIDNQELRKLTDVLGEIRDGQKEQLELQRRQYELVKEQYERHEKLQDRAEEIQNKGAQLVNTARKAMFLILPLIVILVLYITWMLFW